MYPQAFRKCPAYPACVSVLACASKTSPTVRPGRSVAREASSASTHAANMSLWRESTSPVRATCISAAW